MIKRTILGIAGAAALAMAALAGQAGEAQAGVHVSIGVPGLYIGPGPYYYGGYWAPPVYYGPYYHPRYYYHRRAPYHCHKWWANGYLHKKCHRHW
jgi:hypothetical protein